MSASAPYRPLIGSTVTVVGAWVPDGSVPDPGDGPGLAVPLELAGVEDLDHPGPYEQFRLELVGPRDQPLDQGTYVVDPPLGPSDILFLVPSGERDDVRAYAVSLSLARNPAEGDRT